MDTAHCAPWKRSSTQQIRQALINTLPEIVSRKQAAELTGGFLTVKTLANLDALHRGPAHKFMIGRQVGYLKEDFIDFFMEQVR